ncbi:hypothetical protein NQ314_015761 [Rhamnusium bicolor]|uniref:Uncharacterized protein n=1 Tax=Rhamnusium bicolor TaxID=1586634 RepID=A0AAV8WY06_9CUCU|nr:hypothetical protein NQ314_015761 [Rhamnusium bicolor]
MASNEHLVLSEFIKSVHLDLREKSKTWGSENAWKKHCADETNLKKYASAMRELACNYWEENNKKQSKAVSRVHWTCTTCRTYFKQDIFKYQVKEKDIAMKINIAIPASLYSTRDNINKLMLLDVGSCYNPFKQFDYFEVTAIDIAPGLEEVIECDFLKLNVGANAKFMKSWRFILAKMGFSRIKYEKLPHLHCMAFRKAFCMEITQRWADIHNKEQVHDEIFIPQDFNLSVNKDIKNVEKSKSECTDENNVDLINELPSYGIFE